MKFRQFLDTCLAGDDKEASKLGGLGKKAPAASAPAEAPKEGGNPFAAKDKPEAPKATAPVEKKEEPKDEEKKEDPAPKEEKKEEPKAEDKPKDEEKKEEPKKPGMKGGLKKKVEESFDFINSLRSLKEANFNLKSLAQHSLDDFAHEFSIETNSAIEIWMHEVQQKELQTLVKSGCEIEVSHSEHDTETLKQKGWSVFAEYNDDNYEAILSKG